MYLEAKGQDQRSRRIARHIGLLSLIFLFPMKSAFASDSCEANFKADGNQQDGLRFSTSQTIPNMDLHDALEQMRGIAQKNGFQVGSIDYKASEGTLVIQQQASSRARGFSILITAKKDTSSISIATQLPAGMQAKPQDVRGSMCGMLARVKMDGTGGSVATSAPPGLSDTQEASTANRTQTTPPDVLISASSASINETCDANFFGTLDPTIGRSFTTWVPVTSLDPRNTIAQFKQAATLGGLDVGAEDYHGSEGTLTISLKTSNNVKGFPFHILVDQALGTISIATRVNPNQEVPIDGTRDMMCGMIALATGAPAPMPTKGPSKDNASSGFHFRNPFKNPFKEQQKQAADQAQQRANIREERTKIYRSAMDALYKRALAAGKSIVLIPSINLDSKYTPGESQTRHAEFWADQTSTTIWQGTNDPKNTFKVGFDASNDKIGLRGYVYQFAAGKSYYLLYIVNPGTYTVTGNTYEVERASMPQASSTKKSAKPSIGQISLAETKNTEFYQTQEWFNAVYTDRTIKSDYCTLTIAGGPCVQWNASSQTVKDQIDPGGWRNVTKSKLVDGLVVATKLTKEFATFKVDPGEAIMVDGFFAEYPNADFNNDACQQVADSKIQCDMTQYTLTRVPARLDDLKDPNAASASQGLPNLSKILSTMKYRQTKVSATPGNFISGWGQNYSLKEH